MKPRKASNSKKTTAIDDDGICDACRWSDFKKMKLDWAKREKELLKLLDKHGSKSGDYDVVVPASVERKICYVVTS